MRQVRILEKAAEEAIDAVAWYEQQRPGLGLEFGRVVRGAFDLLGQEIVPLATMPGTAGTREVKRLTLKRFPYDIVVRVSPEEITVIAVVHQSRRPGYWRNRIQPRYLSS